MADCRGYTIRQVNLFMDAIQTIERGRIRNMAVAVRAAGDTKKGGFASFLRSMTRKPKND